jgi:Dam-replacing family
MRCAILEDRAANLFLLHYQFKPFTVAASLIFIPNFACTFSTLECRPPLAVTARHAGRIGCNILLNQIPTDAGILLVKDKRSIPAIEARRAFRKLSLSPRSKLKNAAGPLFRSTHAPDLNAKQEFPEAFDERWAKVVQEAQSFAQPGPFAPDSSDSIAPADSCPDSQDDPTKNDSATTGPDASRHKRKLI